MFTIAWNTHFKDVLLFAHPVMAKTATTIAVLVANSSLVRGFENFMLRSL